MSIPSEGLEIDIDLKRPHFNRIIKITLDGEWLDDDKVYSFSTIKHTISGKDGYTEFEEFEQGKGILFNEGVEGLRLFNLSKNATYRKEFRDFKQTKMTY